MGWKGNNRETRSKTEVRGKRVRGGTRVVRAGQGACVALTGGRCGLREDVTPPRKLARVTAPGHQPEGRAAKLENREEKVPTLAQPARIGAPGKEPTPSPNQPH